MSATIFDSRSASYRDPFGAVSAGTGVRLSIRLSKTVSHESQELWVFRADQWNTAIAYPMEVSQCRSSCTL